MFFETDEGKLLNLTLLQNVQVINSSNDINKYSIGYFQINGEILEEGSFNTELEALNALDTIKTKLLS